jgi:DNA-binding MarR family transcriptional regulator
MSSLLVNDEMSFNALKELLDVTDGNLASHIKPLEEAKYIKVHKSFVGKKPNTTYSITKSGTTAFTKHIEALEKIIRQAGL